MVRDRLGQGLFGDRTHDVAEGESPTFEAGQSFSASFRFRFPYVFSGEYSLEAAVYEGLPGRNRMLARLRDTAFLSMQSPHPGGGLVNILMNAVSLTVDHQETASELPSEPEAAGARDVI
jgi:lipopolysaccharide transport system ATP-binding protein